MRAVKASFFAATMVCLLGASAAWACETSGKFVCSTDTSIGIGGLPVTISSLYETVNATTCNDASVCEVGTFSTHVTYAADYALDPSGAVAYCGAPDYLINYGMILVDDPVQCPGDKPANCSPGYYKSPKGKLTWDTECAEFYAPLGDYAHVLWMLSAEEGAGLTDRAAAKAALDACFGTASNSPCEYD